MDITKIITKNYSIVLTGQGFQGKEMAILLNKLDSKNVPYIISTINERDIKDLKGKIGKKNSLAIGSLGKMKEELGEELKLEPPLIPLLDFSETYDEKPKKPKYLEKPDNAKNYKSPTIIKQRFNRKTKL